MDVRGKIGSLTLANQLTFLRLVAIPLFLLLILYAHFAGALALFVLASLTDLLDGIIARVLRQRTVLGAYLDPAADKLLTTAAFIVLTRYPSMFQQIPMAARIPAWLTVLAITRDLFILLVAALLYLALGRTGFQPSLWGKLTTGAEMGTAGLFLLANALGRPFALLDAAVGVTLALILVSGLHYLWTTVSGLRAAHPSSGGEESGP